jgi:hypothetical protein
MKKILFIMILATTLIPISQTVASDGNRNISYKAKDVQTVSRQEPDNVLNSESSLMPEKTNREPENKNISRSKTRLKKDRISSEKKDRLFGLLLLAYGGQR